MRYLSKAPIIQMSRILLAVLIAATLLGGNQPLQAQTAAGSIVGIVRDHTGNVVPGAQVTVLNRATNQSVSATTNASGYYSFPLLQPALYQITVQASGFKEYLQDNIQLDVAQTRNVDVNLEVGQVTESVTVTAAPPLLETQTSSLGEVIPNKSVVDLPLNGRNAYGFAALVPGVIAPYGFSQTAFDEYNDQFISINGSRPNQNLFLLDGGMNSEPAFTGPGYFPSVDLVEEYKVQTNNLGAEFSNTGGGIINVRYTVQHGGSSGTRIYRQMTSFPMRQASPGHTINSASLEARSAARSEKTRPSSSSPMRGCAGCRADPQWAPYRPQPSVRVIFPVPTTAPARSSQSTIRLQLFPTPIIRVNISELNIPGIRFLPHRSTPSRSPC
jgi:hypothetical protein